MVNTITFNPIVTSTAAGSFNVTSEGFIQGTALDSPHVRNFLAGGYLAPTETLPMWGGVGISELIPGLAGNPLDVIGTTVSRALALAAQAAGQLTGFSVFDQDHSMINSPQSPVPLASAYMGVNFYRLGTKARIAVAIDPALVSLEGGLITPAVSWDFNLQRLAPGQAAWNANVITAASWAATGGGQATYTTTTPHGVGVGPDVTISGMTPAGYNGDFKTIAGTAGSTIVVAMPANPGPSTVQGTLVAGGGLLPVTVLDVNIGNSMTVSYDPVTGFATWNRSGSCAIIQI
jgi:hypothetical protein